MGTVREWEFRATGAEGNRGWLWLDIGGDYVQCCHVTLRDGGTCYFSSVPTLNKELIADLSWVCYQIEGGKKKGRLR